LKRTFTVNYEERVNENRGELQMVFKSLLAAAAVAAGGLGLALSAGAGSALADPVVDTTCSYKQFTAALNANDPSVGNMLANSPDLQQGLRGFIAAPPSDRAPAVAGLRSQPGAQPFIPALERAFSTCNNF
jgi:hemophore-related protein